MAHSCVVLSPALLLVLEVYTEDIVGVVVGLVDCMRLQLVNDLNYV